jgi:hypothetical protein
LVQNLAAVSLRSAACCGLFAVQLGLLAGAGALSVDVLARTRRRWALAATMGLGAALVLAVGWLEVRRVEAEVLLRRGEEATAREDWPEAVRVLGRAEAVGPGRTRTTSPAGPWPGPRAASRPAPTTC